MLLGIGPVLGFFLLIIALANSTDNPKAVFFLVFGAFAGTALLGALMITAVGGWHQILNPT